MPAAVNLIISSQVWHTSFSQEALGWSLCCGWLQSQQDLNCVLAMPQPQGHILSIHSLWFILHCSAKLLAFASPAVPSHPLRPINFPSIPPVFFGAPDWLDLPWAPLHCSPGHCSLRITTIMITTKGLAQACDPSTQEGARPCSPQRQHVIMWVLSSGVMLSQESAHFSSMILWGEHWYLYKWGKNLLVTLLMAETIKQIDR